MGGRWLNSVVRLKASLAGVGAGAELAKNLIVKVQSYDLKDLKLTLFYPCHNNDKKNKKQAEAEVVPSSSLVEI